MDDTKMQLFEEVAETLLMVALMAAALFLAAV